MPVQPARYCTRSFQLEMLLRSHAAAKLQQSRKVPTVWFPRKWQVSWRAAACHRPHLFGTLLSKIVLGIHRCQLPAPSILPPLLDLRHDCLNQYRAKAGAPPGWGTKEPSKFRPRGKKTLTGRAKVVVAH